MSSAYLKPVQITKTENGGETKADEKSAQESLEPVGTIPLTEKNRKRMVKLGGVMIVLACLCALIGFFIFGSSSAAKESERRNRNSNGRADRSGRANAQQVDHSENMTAAAIEQVRSEVVPPNSNVSRTAGYVLVTSLPAEMRGRDADGELAPDGAEALRILRTLEETRGAREK